MTDVNNQVDSQESQQQEQTTADDATFKTLEDAVKALEAEKSAKAKLEQDLANSRKGEKFHKTKVSELEKALALGGDPDLAKQLEQKAQEVSQLQGKIRNQAVDSVLKEELTKAGAKSLSTVMKIVDRSKIVVNDDDSVDTESVKAYIEGMKKEDSILFGVEEAKPVKQTIAPKRAGEASVTASYETELDGAKTMKQLQAVMKKYGIQGGI